MLELTFLKVIDMSFTAAIIIGIVLVARIFLKRFPKYISYALWGVVLFRLLCPYSFESAYSLVPDVKPVSYQYEMATDTVSVPEESGGENFSGIASDLRKSDIQAVILRMQTLLYIIPAQSVRMRIEKSTDILES